MARFQATSAQRSSMFRTINDNGGVIVIPQEFTFCVECGTDNGKGMCRSCKLFRFNLALVKMTTEISALPAKLSDAQVAERADWAKVAITYAAIYSGDNDFLRTMRDTWKVRKSLSIGQMRGILNVIRATAMRTAQDAAPAVAAVAPVNFRPISDGYYTVAFEDGTHVTLRINTVKTGPNAGKRFASYLNGPINTSDYARFAFVNQDGYRAFRNGNFQKQTAALQVLMTATDETQTAFGKAYGMESGNCYVCNRLLTDPESISAGIGPICEAARS